MTCRITEFTLPICATQTQNKSTNNNKGRTAGLTVTPRVSASRRVTVDEIIRLISQILC